MMYLEGRYQRQDGDRYELLAVGLSATAYAVAIQSRYLIVYACLDREAFTAVGEIIRMMPKYIRSVPWRETE